MSENERLANEVTLELQRAILAYLTNKYTAEQFLQFIKVIVKASQLA